MEGRAHPGSPEPLGATPLPGGTNFAVYSANATAIEVCLFDAAGEVEMARVALTERTGDVFHGFIPGVVAGARYGLRAHGPHARGEGHWFDPAKLLVDPYAVALDRPFALHPSMFDPRQSADGGHFDDLDSAPHMPKAVVTPPDLPGVRPAWIPWSETVIYELHVRGFSMRHPDIAHEARGTFAALADPAAIAHLKGLGVTTVEVMPAAAWIDERHLPPSGLSNYWGYNPVALMAPDSRLAPGGWAKIAATTAALAAAGIETILDVVFNHTGEGDALGPTLSLRGLDNATYYRLSADGRYVDDSGCGDTLALDRPATMRLGLDALRTWARRGGVSGFRFDLATVMGRRAEGFDPAAPLLTAIAQDPELRTLKLIAEPWDCGPGGYQLGSFPAEWGEWNDRFRDSARRFWRGDGGFGDLASRLSGSQDLMAAHRRPSRSVNFVSAHDGFTLADVVAYSAKHNEANGEHNRDGSSHEVAWNNGVEGPSADPEIATARLRDQRALLATLMLSRGTPMLAMGAELGQTQGGNNNAYCQDNELAWLDWTRADGPLTAYVARLAKLRREHPALHADRFLTGRATGAAVYPDVEWLTAQSLPMTAEAWSDARETLLVILADPEGDDARPGRLALIFHRGSAPAGVALPVAHEDHQWTLTLDSADDEHTEAALHGPLTVAARSVTVLAETPVPIRRTTGVAQPLLDQLAAAAGIASDWWSVDGVGHAVSPDTQRALLVAMRRPAGSNAEARAALRHLADERDRRPLPHAVVRREGEIVELPLAVEPGAPARAGWVTIEGEDGGVQRLRAEGRRFGFSAVDGRAAEAISVVLPALQAGRYRVIREDQPDLPCRLTIAPAGCYTPPALANDARLYGVAAQLYSVRRDGDQGVGDFTTLEMLASAATAEGAATIGLNPLHALFGNDRERASPYHPSDRRFLDPIYLDLARIDGARETLTEASSKFAALSAKPMVDYPGVWALKQSALEQAFARMGDAPAFEAFIAEGGRELHQFATFEAISEAHPHQPWQAWPSGLGLAGGHAVVAFAVAHAERVRFHQFLQWQCDSQLAAAARAGGLALGLYRDLAVGAAPDGAEAWANADTLSWGVSIGAPPDPLGPDGQVWGLPPPDPHRWRAAGYAPFISLLRANMRHAGALRIDHVMGLARLFWVPEGARGEDGAYVAYPLQDLLGELALESERARCLVIGENLGTVPHGFNDALEQANVLSYRVLPFERDGAVYRPPSRYPRRAVACVASHDLPTLAGWWNGADIAERERLGLSAPPEAGGALAARQADKAELLRALVEAGLIPPGAKFDHLDQTLAAAITTFVAATPSALALIQIDDLAGETEAVNLPGTDRERPNWRRKVAPRMPDLFSAEPAASMLAAARRERGPAGLHKP